MSCNTRFLRALAAESYPSSYKVHRLNASLSDRNAVGSSRTKPSMSRMASFIRHVYNAQRPILLTHSVNSACRGSGAAIVGPTQSSARYFGQSVSCFRSWSVALLKHSNACSQLPLAKYRSPWLTSKRGETVCTMGIFSNSEFMVAEAWVALIQCVFARPNLSSASGSAPICNRARPCRDSTSQLYAAINIRAIACLSGTLLNLEWTWYSAAEGISSKISSSDARANRHCPWRKKELAKALLTLAIQIGSSFGIRSRREYSASLELTGSSENCCVCAAMISVYGMKR